MAEMQALPRAAMHDRLRIEVDRAVHEEVLAVEIALNEFAASAGGLAADARAAAVCGRCDDVKHTGVLLRVMFGSALTALSRKRTLQCHRHADISAMCRRRRKGLRPGRRFAVFAKRHRAPCPRRRRPQLSGRQRRRREAGGTGPRGRKRLASGARRRHASGRSSGRPPGPGRCRPCARPVPPANGRRA